jgi:NDP-sugar pyrophosphorylase family protein
MIEWMPNAQTIDRVGMKELSPGIWVDSHAHIAPMAQLNAPCWIGQSAYIGAGAVVGPMAIVEDRAFIETGAEVVSSVICADTFVGQLAALKDSFAEGNTLINWKSGSCVKITDAFMLSALRRPATLRKPINFLARLTDLLFPEEKRQAEALETFLMNKQG